MSLIIKTSENTSTNQDTPDDHHKFAPLRCLVFQVPSHNFYQGLHQSRTNPGWGDRLPPKIGRYPEQNTRITS
jgi:hypothetical protein